jgi:hypothetical protein
VAEAEAVLTEVVSARVEEVEQLHWCMFNEQFNKSSTISVMDMDNQ